MGQKSITQSELEDRLYDIQEAAEDLLRDIRDSIIATELEEKVTSIEDFRRNVMLSIPEGASLKFREDVENWLDSINTVY
jgi:hypothetical protein